MIVRRDEATAKAILDSVLGLDLIAPFMGFVIWNKAGWPAAAFCYNSWTGADAQLTLAVNEPLTIREIRTIARLGFEGLGLQRITCKTSVDNERSIKSMSALGFVRECAAIDHFGRDRHAFVYVLLRRSQRLLKGLE